MAYCDCGAHVSDDYARVFGDNSDDVVKCMNCTDTYGIDDEIVSELNDD